jgi:hypothetical protein
LAFIEELPERLFNPDQSAPKTNCMAPPLGERVLGSARTGTS